MNKGYEANGGEVMVVTEGCGDWKGFARLRLSGSALIFNALC